ncbi:MAG: ABC transporter substrate-binding protein [Deltaproteobacteria bacterium]|nr:ABC transporter substrate-binding protein [Deltaproteobacteria bacterium]
MLVLLCCAHDFAWAQGERAVISHNSESITIAPILYGIDKGFYRNEGIHLEFRFLRTDLAAAAVNTQELDYMISAGTAMRAAVRGLPLKIVAYSFTQPLFYLMTPPTIQSVKELRGKKIAVSSPQDSGGQAAKAAIRAGGLDPERDVVYIAIGAASVRMAAMEIGSVDAAIQPVPWNSRMKKKGFKELLFAGSYLAQPLTGMVTSAAKVEKNSDQVRRVLRAYLLSLRRLRQEKNEVVEFIAKRFGLERDTGEEVYKVMLDTMSSDGTMPASILDPYFEQVRNEPGAKKSILLNDIVDYRLLREVTASIK